MFCFIPFCICVLFLSLLHMCYMFHSRLYMRFVSFPFVCVLFHSRLYVCFASSPFVYVFCFIPFCICVLFHSRLYMCFVSFPFVYVFCFIPVCICVLFLTLLYKLGFQLRVIGLYYRAIIAERDRSGSIQNNQKCECFEIWIF